ncbi:MAG: hypothetical protein R6W96_03640 [Clostridia bacterium]
MLGIPDGSVLLAYILSIASAVLCLVYGIANWNKGKDKEPVQIEEEIQWEKKETEIKDNL